MSKYNALDHEMVPEHIVLDDDEVEELTDRYEINKTDLPKIGRLPPRARRWRTVS